MIGRVIGTYRIESLLGKGGMGTVYRGLDLMLDRPVAVKALRADVAASPQHVERFRQEAKTLARLLDPHIATLYALHRDGDDLYMVMEFVEGETFEALLHRERRLPVGRALALFGQALRGLEHAHRRGIVHRDVKPANFMLTPGGTVKVMDFGIARLLGSSRMTQTRHAIGTAEYMAPEQVRARDVDARTDVYALGVMLYEMVTGRVPFDAESAFETMQAHLQTDPPSPRRFAPDLPEAVEAAIRTALAKDPAERHASVAAFRTALADVAPAEPLVAPSPEAIQTVPAAPPKATVAAPVRPEEPTGDNSTAEDPYPDIPEAEPTPAEPTAEPDPTPAPEPQTTIAPSATGDEAESPQGLVDLLSDDGRQPAPTVASPVLADPDETVPTGRRPAPPTRLARSATPATTAAPSLAAVEDQAERTSLRSRFASVPRPALAAVAGALVAAATWALWPSAEPVGPVGQVTSTPAPETRGSSGARASLGPTAPNRPSLPSLPGQTPAVGDAPGGSVPVEPDPPPSADAPTDRQESSPSRQPPADPEPARERTPARTEPPPPEHIASRSVPAEPARPQTGTARVLVRPFGDVYIDGRRLARGTNAPVTAELAPGTYTVRATHPEFGELTRSVRVRAGETADVRLQFATPAEITVVSDPINAEILLDGRPTGRYTPAVVTVPPGRHTISAERDGYAPARQSVTVEAGRAPSRITLTLSPLNAP